jgi:hypothetical protein|tara:strand:+ start:177 stop:374 length:198 start_codon:yes stop_codon:yes gene_type:complete
LLIHNKGEAYEKDNLSYINSAYVYGGICDIGEFIGLAWIFDSWFLKLKHRSIQLLKSSWLIGYAY